MHGHQYFNTDHETLKEQLNYYLWGGWPVQRLLSGSITKHIERTCLDEQVENPRAKQLPKCLYQPVQGVVDLMDTRQCSQVRIQLKIWFNTIQRRLNSHKVRHNPRVVIKLLSLARVRW